MPFQNKIVISPLDNVGRLWILQAPLVYQTRYKGRDLILEVPVYFVCDLNSMPRLTWIIAPKTDYPAAGALHDFLYRFGKHGIRATLVDKSGNRTIVTLKISRRWADRIYRESLISLGMWRPRAHARWLGLRLFGWTAYNGGPRWLKTIRARIQRTA